MGQLCARLGIICLSVLLSPFAAAGDVRLPAVIGDHMVLQRGMKAPIWGWAEPGEKVSVRASWQWLGTSTRADENGKWMVKIAVPRKADGPHRLTIKGQNTLTLEDVLVGEVWLCSGQSNMWWPVAQSRDAQAEIAAAQFPQIRLFNVTEVSADTPQKDCQGQWSPCTPETVADFSAAAYFFGRALYRELHVPIGLIQSSVGGTEANCGLGKRLCRTIR